MTHGCCCQIFQERFGPLSLSGQTLCTAMAHRTQQAGIDSCQPCQRPGIQLIIFPTTLTDKSHVYADNSVHTKGVCLSRLGGRLRRALSRSGEMAWSGLNTSAICGMSLPRSGLLVSLLEIEFDDKRKVNHDLQENNVPSARSDGQHAREAVNS